jgi:hypothetical protein
MKPRLAALVTLVGAAGGLSAGCHRVERKVERLIEATGLAAAAESRAPEVGPTGTLDVHARTSGPHPRILLTAERLAAVDAQVSAGTKQWRVLLERCQDAESKVIGPGYEAWDWGNAALSLALCAKVTKNPRFAAAGVRYFKALLDDKGKVGDGAGGNEVVHHDLGYSIRTHGALGAIAYDWLYDAPDMTPALKHEAMDRFVAWTSWFKENGYNHDEPISNYYVSYFATVALGGIAFDGDDPRASGLRQQTERMWNQEVVPSYRGKLQGGDFPEGWQYGDGVGAFLAIYADAESRRTPVASSKPPKSLFDDLPWLRDAVRLRALSLLPDGKSMYDGGDWEKPVVAPPHMLFALATVLPPSDPASRQAAFLARLARVDVGEEWKWLQVLASDPTRAVEDPRKGQASYLSVGTATVFARSSFSPSSLWFSLSSAPSLSDHQHLDAGHFEVVRGPDSVLIDSGDYASYSSVSHNVVLVDDPLQSPIWDVSKEHHDIITYKRNQGTWSDTAHIAAFEDDGGYVYARAEYDSAFNPAGWSARKPRAVTRAEREVVFSRAPVSGAGPGETGRVVVYDRFTLSDPRFTTTFILHGGLAPQITGSLARFTTGGSSAWVTTLVPAGVTPGVVDETQNKTSDDRPYFTNRPPSGVTSFRYEVASPASPPSTERRFLHAIVIGAKGGAPASPVAIAGDGVAGAVIDEEAYVFSSVGPGVQARPVSYTAPQAATRHVVCDLAPSASFTATAAPEGGGCKVTLTPGPGKTASAKGVLALDVTGCNVH